MAETPPRDATLECAVVREHNNGWSNALAVTPFHASHQATPDDFAHVEAVALRHAYRPRARVRCTLHSLAPNAHALGCLVPLYSSYCHHEQYRHTGIPRWAADADPRGPRQHPSRPCGPAGNRAAHGRHYDWAAWRGAGTARTNRPVRSPRAAARGSRKNSPVTAGVLIGAVALGRPRPPPPTQRTQFVLCALSVPASVAISVAIGGPFRPISAFRFPFRAFAPDREKRNGGKNPGTAGLGAERKAACGAGSRASQPDRNRLTR